MSANYPSSRSRVWREAAASVCGGISILLALVAFCLANYTLLMQLRATETFTSFRERVCKSLPYCRIESVGDVQAYRASLREGWTVASYLGIGAAVALVLLVVVRVWWACLIAVVLGVAVPTVIVRGIYDAATLVAEVTGAFTGVLGLIALKAGRPYGADWTDGGTESSQVIRHSGGRGKGPWAGPRPGPPS